MVTSKEIKPPLGGFGPSHADWERSSDPWHRNAAPVEFADSFPNQGPIQAQGWMALDAWGNPIGFVPDGTELKN